MAPHRAIVDFFVVPQAGATWDETVWLLCRGESHHCVGVLPSQADAIAGAKRMAAYGLLRGQQARIKVWQSTPEGWLVVWCSWENDA